MAHTITLLTPLQKAHELGIHKETLRRWRRAGTGPQYKQLGPQIVRYYPELIEVEPAQISGGA